MRRLTAGWWLAWCVLLASPAWSATKAPPHARAAHDGALEFQGRRRAFRFHRPANPPPSAGWPLVLVLHGAGGSSERMEALSVGRFTVLAEQEGFLVVYPEAVKFRGHMRQWNDGRLIRRFAKGLYAVDDVGYVGALIDQFIAEQHADASRVYVVGVSNGGVMAQRVACELADRVAAVASVIAGMAKRVYSHCAPASPLSVLLVAGTHDPWVPWGLEGGHPREFVEEMVSIEETARFWARHNRCPKAPWREALPDRVSDGTHVVRNVYKDCRLGGEVWQYDVQGAGHTWPGGYQYAPERVVGRVSREFDAADVIWQFVQQYRREPSRGKEAQ